MIDRATFSRWMAVFGDRIGRKLEPPTLTAYYAALSPELDTDTFQRAALHVFKTHGYNTWPEPDAFLGAGRMLRRDPDAEVKATQKLLARYADAPPPREEAVDEFGRTWRQVLADCRPDVIRAERRAQMRTPDGLDQWLTNERRPAPAPSAPPPGPMPGPSIDEIAAEDAA